MHEPELLAVPIEAVNEVADEARLASWLGPRERCRHAALRVAKRRRDWLAGRVAAKTLIARRHQLDGATRFGRIAIDALTDGPERGRPQYAVDHVVGPFDLSISHSGDTALAALARHSGDRIGVDVELPINDTPGFDDLALAASEQALLARLDAPTRADFRARVWVVKEALLKAIGAGLRARLGDVVVALDPVTGALADRPLTLLAADGPLASLDLERLAVGTFRLGAAHGAWVTCTC